MKFINDSTQKAYTYASLLLLPVTLFGVDYSPSESYYSSADGLLGTPLRTVLHDIIDGQNNMNYSNDLPVLWSITEVDPNDPDRILLIYSGISALPDPTEGGWNREHTWPRSYGAGDGAAFSDAHHLYPCDADVNQTRLNYIFDYAVVKNPVNEAPGSFVDFARDIFEPRDEDKGRIARAQLYMDLRYNANDLEGDLRLTDFPNSSLKRFGKLTTLLEWNRMYPPDERERMRNHTIHKGFFQNNKLYWQGNRNPFTDFPELGDALHTATDFVSWGSWRIEHFSFVELLDSSISDPLEDPDLDGLSNLFELSQNGNPRNQVTENLPHVLYSGEINGKEFVFDRIRRADRSHMEVIVEHSIFPTEESFWQPIVIDDQNSVITPDGFIENVAFQESSLPEAERERHFRLKVERRVPDQEAIVSIFDPIRYNEPDSASPFLYASNINDTWAESDWFGLVSDRDYPWIYHPNHHWVWSVTQDEVDQYLFDEGIGWYWTGFQAYPFVFSFTLDKWLYFLEQTESPNRTFIDIESGLEIFEMPVF